MKNKEKIIKELEKEGYIVTAPEERKTMILEGWEYEIETHDFNKTLSEIKIPRGWELWSVEDCIKLHNSTTYRKKLNLELCWFFIKQPFEFNKEYVAWFGVNSDGAFLFCDRGPSGSGASLGVRFKRKV